MQTLKPLYFLAVMAVLLTVDMVLPRPEGWPKPLLPKERALALLHLGAEPSASPASPDDVERAAPELPPVLASKKPFGPELPPNFSPPKPFGPPLPPDYAPPKPFGPELPPNFVVAKAPAPAGTGATPQALADAQAGTTPASIDGKPAKPLPEEPFVKPEDPRWSKLEAKLAQRASGEDAVVRVVHIGDSEIANDLVARTLRRHFVERYGDAGPGFVLALAPWTWYARDGFTSEQPDAFSSHSVALTRKGDGNFGPGGVAFDARSNKAQAMLSMDPQGHPTCEAALLYGIQPDGAELELFADGKSLERISSAGEEVKVGRKELHLDPCPKKLSVRAHGTPSRLFGWTVEWGKPGVTWSSLGVVGASSIHYLRYGAGRIGDGLAALKPDLLVVSHGLNVANRPAPPPQEERQGLERILAELKAAAPNAACLVMSPYPIAYADGDQINPSPATALLAKMQREVAKEQGCAFLDRQAMEGGPKMALRWLNTKPRILSGDYVHLTNSGSEKVGTDVAQKLLHGLATNNDD